MRKRDLRLDKHGISKKRYKELCGFCEQYPEWQHQLREYDLLPSQDFDGMPKNPNKGESNPTLKAVIKAEMLMANCQIIETVARQASEDLWEYIIKSVCYEVPLTYLIMVDNMPCGKSAFYEVRRYFFYLLDIAKKKEKEASYIDVNCGKK